MRVINNRAKGTAASKEAWGYSDSCSPEPPKGPAFFPAPAALLSVVGQQRVAGWSHPESSPFAPVACLVGSLWALLELADLGHLFKITHRHRKRGNWRKQGLPVRCPGDDGTSSLQEPCPDTAFAAKTPFPQGTLGSCPVPGARCWKPDPGASRSGAGGGRPAAFGQDRFWRRQGQVGCQGRQGLGKVSGKGRLVRACRRPAARLSEPAL